MVVDTGPLPRSELHKDQPYKHLPKYTAEDKDNWTRRKALFGQNDYIGLCHTMVMVAQP